jgi:hypothetical protein
MVDLAGVIAVTAAGCRAEVASSRLAARHMDYREAARLARWIYQPQSP